MDVLNQYLDALVDSSGPNEIEHRENNLEITISYDIRSEQLLVSHFYIPEQYRRNNNATSIYNQLLDYARNNEYISTFQFHIKKTTESVAWLDNMDIEYHESKMGGVGTILEFNKRV